MPSSLVLATRGRGLAVLATGLIFGVIPLAAQEYQFPTHGGSGGTSFDITCGNSAVLVGVKGRKDQWLDQLTALCVMVKSDGNWSGSAFEVGPAGGTGGTSFASVRCPDGSAVASISGRHGWYVHQLSLACYRMGPGAAISGTFTANLSAGAAGGDTSWTWELCPNAKPGKGLRGRKGWYIDAVRFVCHSGAGYPRVVPVVTAAPQLFAPPNATTLTDLRPTFSWAYTSNAARYQICITREGGGTCSMVNESITQSFSGTNPVPTSTFRPAANLAFAPATRATWSVRGCSAAGCGPWASSRWILAPATATPPPAPAVSFVTDLAPTFRHERCVNCHAVVATNFARATPGLGAAHTVVSASTTCQSCHTNTLLPTQGTVNPGWHGAPASMDLRNLTDAQLCQRARDPGTAAGSVLNHLTQDKLILWAIADGRLPNSIVRPTAPPNSISTWQTRVQNWINAGMPCP